MTHFAADVASQPSSIARCDDETPELRIGSRTLPTRYLLAPLAGYTHLAFRRVLRETGGVGLATTDLVHATQLLVGNPKSTNLIATSPEDRPLSVQIFGSSPHDMARAARWLEDHGYEGVDLNMGCPMAKIGGSGGGARLLCDAGGAMSVVEAVVEACRVPVTVKMRLGWDRSQRTAPAFARAFADVGVAAVTIHGRTRAQGFSGNVDLDGIAAVVDAAPSIPVIGNGDVRTVDDALAMRRITGCAAVAIGRGAMLDPWIFRKLADVSAGLPLREPAPHEQIQFLRRHFALMAETHGERSCVLFRKFAAWYGCRLGIPEPLEDRLRRIESIAHFSDLCDEIAERHGQRVGSVATALLKVPNGPVEHW